MFLRPIKKGVAGRSFVLARDCRPVRVLAGQDEGEGLVGDWLTLFSWSASQETLTALAGEVEVDAVFARDCKRVASVDGVYDVRDYDEPVFDRGGLEVYPEVKHLIPGTQGPDNTGPYGTLVNRVEQSIVSVEGVAGQDWYAEAIPSGSPALQVLTANQAGYPPVVSFRTCVKSGQFDLAVLGLAWLSGGSPVSVPLAVISTLTGEVTGFYDGLGGAAPTDMMVETRPLSGGVFEVLIVHENPAPETAVMAYFLFGAPDENGALAWAGDGETPSSIYATFTGTGSSEHAVRFVVPLVVTEGGDFVDMPGDELSWPLPATVQAALADVGAFEARLSFCQGVGLLPDGPIASTDVTFTDDPEWEGDPPAPQIRVFGDNHLLFMDSGDLCVSDGAETASVAFEPEYGVEYDLRAEWGADGLRVGWKLASGSTWTWSSYAVFSGAMPDEGGLVMGGIGWPIYPASAKFEAVA